MERARSALERELLKNRNSHPLSPSFPPPPRKQKKPSPSHSYNPGEIAVTENGVSAPGEDAKTPEEAVKDTFRVDFFKGYFAAAEKAVKNDGVPLKTYFVWSFMDNLEWAMGYKERFGITYVDYKSKNLTRIPKDSFKWLSRLYENDV